MLHLDMANHNSGAFITHKIKRVYGRFDGEFDDLGKPIVSTGQTAYHNATIQAASMQELQSLDFGNERTNDARAVYLNDGINPDIKAGDEWYINIDGRGVKQYKCLSLDNRPWRNYCKAILVLLDE